MSIFVSFLAKMETQDCPKRIRWVETVTTSSGSEISLKPPSPITPKFCRCLKHVWKRLKKLCPSCFDADTNQEDYGIMSGDTEYHQRIVEEFRVLYKKQQEDYNSSLSELLE